ncbi:MAG TPA: transglycosylase, partial [Methylophaga aminisulfidivorans]|nr:transglycosylase [Methylophaga aminisulfidivorans]
MFSSQSFATGEIKLKQQRNTFQHAIKALKTQQIPRYNELKQKLEGYPLQGYLEYLYLKNHLSTASNNSLSQFFEAQEDAFYSQRLRSSWLSKLAKQNRWQDFLVFYEPSSSASQQCLYLQALIATKQTKKAFELTPKMWLVGHSQDSACDPVFSAWQQAGLLTNQLITERMMLALRENQFSIASYLAKKTASAKHNIALVTRWQAMHQNPSAELNKVKEAQSPLAKEIIVHGLERLARRSPKASY